MARPVKIGLDYFPFDIDFFSDEKIEYITAEFGIKGEIVVIKLLCRIYRNGYYLAWSDDTAILFAKRAGEGISGALVNSVVNVCCKRGFFSKTLFTTYSILTSEGIQRRYFDAVERRKEIKVIREYLLISLPSQINVIIYSINADNNAINEYINPQSKVEETKQKNIIEKENTLRSQIFEIFFFKNFINPEQEVQKFIDHYARTNWLDANGNPITEPLSAARNWQQFAFGKKKEIKPPFATPLLEKYELLYNEISRQVGREKAKSMLKVKKLLIQDNILNITCTQQLIDFFEKELIPNYHFGDTFTKIMYPLTRIMYTLIS